MEYAITGIIVAVLVVGIIWACLARKKLLDNGEIIKRKMNFMKMAEVFTLITPDPHTVVSLPKATRRNPPVFRSHLRCGIHLPS